MRHMVRGRQLSRDTEHRKSLRRSLVRWLHSAYEAGLDNESVLALFQSTFQDTQQERPAPQIRAQTSQRRLTDFLSRWLATLMFE